MNKGLLPKLAHAVAATFRLRRCHIAQAKACGYRRFGSRLNNEGVALGVTLIYIVMVSLLCAAALYYGMNHYKAISRRVDRMQKFYSAEGGIYLGILAGYRNPGAPALIGENEVEVTDDGSTLQSQTEEYRKF